MANIELADREARIKVSESGQPIIMVISEDGKTKQVDGVSDILFVPTSKMVLFQTGEGDKAQYCGLPVTEDSDIDALKKAPSLRFNF